MVESYSLYQFNEYLKRVIALNFSEAIWIHAEILQINESRGNHYLELIEKKTDGLEIIAQSSAVIWYKTALFLKNKLKNNLDPLLQSGVEVKLNVSLDFNERYGLKLVIKDIDASYTLGKLEIQRLALIERLEKEGLIKKNSIIALPTICQHIAVISSRTAAGYLDFMTQLSENNYGYRYKIEFFDSAMQGQNTSKDVSNALQEIANRQEEFDCAIIIRGGGAKLDLASFDDYQICKHIANAPIPILTGIGHEIDQGIADIVSHTNLKTPTAVADFFIDRALHFESLLIQFFQQIKEETLSIVELEKTILGIKENDILNAATWIINSENEKILRTREQIDLNSKNVLLNQQKELKRIEEIIELSDPKIILKKGYALVRQCDEIITSKKKLNIKKKMTIIFTDGEVLSQSAVK